MTFEELEAELAAGRLRPAYVLLGEEPLLQQDALAAIRRAVLGDALEDFNLDRLEACEADPGRVVDALRTLPVLAARRLIWLRDLGAGRDAPKALVEALPRLVEEARAGTSVLVVTAPIESRRAGWVRSVREGAAVVSCEPPRGRRALLAFIRAEAQRQEVSLEPRAVEHLAERIGPQLLMLRNEIGKAALLAGGERRVRAALVMEGASDVADEPLWSLTDAIGDGRAGEALTRLARLRANGVPPPLVLGSLASHFRKLVQVRAGGSVPGPGFVVEKLTRQARRYAPGGLLHGLAAIHETDGLLKGQGGIPPDLALERLVLNLTSL